MAKEWTGQQAAAAAYLAMRKLHMRERDIDRILAELAWIMEFKDPDEVYREACDVREQFLKASPSLRRW